MKQIKNPILKFFIKTWYSEWFRAVFIMLGVWWQFPLAILIGYKLKLSSESIKTLAIAIYLILIILAFVFNDFSNLRKIGLDEYHKKIEQSNDNPELLEVQE